MDEKIKDKNKYFMLISKNIPKNKVFYGIILTLKFLPLFIITHDWNISFKKGISYWIRKFTLCEIFANSEVYFLYFWLIIILTIILIFVFFIFHFYTLIIKKKFSGKIYTYCIFYIFYAFNQFIYSFLAELIINNKRKEVSNHLYIIIIILCIHLTIGMTYLNIYICTIVLNLPLFIHNNTFIINPLNTIDYSMTLLSIIQGFIQLEFHLQFKNMIIIKIIIRALYVIYYIQDFTNFNKYYGRFYLEFIKKFILSLCFVSCIIEICFYYDYKNHLIVLQKEFGIIFIKIVVEINLAFLFTIVYFHIESKNMIKKVSTFNSNNLKNFDYNMVNFFNILYFKDRSDLLKKVLIELNLNIQKLVHKPLCKDKNCFLCYKYSFLEFNFEMQIYLNKKQNNNNQNLQSDFPLLYQYLYNEISILYDSFEITKREKCVPKLFIVITFHMLFEKNFVKCLYLIEKTNSIDKESRNSLYCHQIEFLISTILSFYKDKEHKTLNLLNSNNENIGKILHAEFLIKNALNTIKDIMINFNSEYINFKSYSNMIVNFIKENKSLVYKINNLFEKSKCNIPYSIDKFTTYFKYIYGDVPKKLLTSLNTYFSLQSSSLIEINMKNTYLLLFKVKFLIKDILLQIKYASPELISKLNYTTNEFKVLDIKNLFAKIFYKSYKFTITDFLRNGKDIIHIENFCLLDKNKYVINFVVEGISLYTTLGMVLFLKLKPAKVELFIQEKKLEKAKTKKKKKNNSNKKDYSDIYGSCLLFTNNNGKIVSLSKTFEDYFHLKYEVLKENRINIKDIFKIQKLEKNGVLKRELLEVYNNIIEIFNEKIGLIGEDSFSKSIITIKEVKDNIYQSREKIKIKIFYEKKGMKRENNQTKYYYLFIVDISGRRNSKHLLTTTMGEVVGSFIIKNNESNILLNDSTNKIEDKFTIQTSLNQKILYSNKLSYYILKKYFKTNVLSKKENEKENNFLLENEEKNKKNPKDIYLNDEILNSKENENLNDNPDVNKYFIIKTDYFILRYLASGISFTFVIIFIFMINHKLSSLSDQENYFRGHINFEMVGLTLMDVLSKVLYMQFQGNKLQPEILENYFNNTFNFHSEQLINRIYDYNSFFIKFYQFYTGRVVGTDPYFFDLYEKAVLYKIPDQHGRKIETIAQMASIHLIELLSSTINNGPIEVFYNNSYYYYTLDMVNKTNIHPLDYYYSASGFVGFLVNFLASYKYYNNEITNYYGTYALDKKISSQRGISTSIILVIGVFFVYSLICFFIFYFQTQKLFARYFICFTQLRFFNNYIYNKTILLYAFIDNHQSINKLKNTLNKIEFENDFEHISIIKHIMSGKIETFKQIKLKSLTFKHKIINDNINEQNETTINRNESLILNLIKGSSKTFSRNNTKNHNSFAIPLNVTKTFNQINYIEPKKKNSEKIITSIINSKKKGKIGLITKNLGNNSTTRTNITTSSFASSINIMNNLNSQNKDLKQNSISLTGNRLLSKPILYIELFLTLIILGIILIVIAIIYYKYSFNLVDSFIIIMSTFRSLFAEIKFPNEMLLDLFMSILRNEEFTTKYESTPYSEICGSLKYQYDEKVILHEMFVELSFCWPEFKPTVDTLILGIADKKMANLINFQFETEGKFFCENYAKFLIENKDNKKLNDIKLLEDITYESILNECNHIGHGLNNEGFQTVLLSVYNTLNTLYDQFKDNKNRSEKYNYDLLNDDNLVMMQLEAYYVFSKMNLCYYLIMNIDMENAHESALRNESLFLTLQLCLMIIIIFIYLYNVIKYSTEIGDIIFFNKCILHMILFK